MADDTQNQTAAIQSRLAPVAGDRLAGVRVGATGAVTLVLETGGMDAAARDALEQAVRGALADMGVEELRVAHMAERSAQAPTPKGPRLIAVGSGKGGVGKSTLSANLAVALARKGRKVGLVDADIYGPSQPRLLAAEGMTPTAREKQLIPVQTAFGVKMLSMGQLVEAGKAIAWRGPMAAGALTQLMEADWGDIDDLVIDLRRGCPPDRILHQWSVFTEAKFSKHLPIFPSRIVTPETRAASSIPVFVFQCTPLLRKAFL